MSTRHKQHINTLNFINDVQKVMPVKTVEEIKNHIECHDQYILLQEEKKKVLCEYNAFKK